MEALLETHQSSQSNRKQKVVPIAGYCDGNGNGCIEGFERFCWDFFRVRLYNRQREIADKYFKLKAPKRRMAVKSGHSVGKTTLVALLVLYDFSCLKRSCITSSPGTDAVKKGVWNDIEKHMLTAEDAGKPLPGEFLREPKLRVDSDPDWWAYGFYTDRPERAQGKKHPRLSLFLDEASGFEEWFWEAIDSSMSSGGARMLATGNPLHLADRFYRIFSNEKVAKHWEIMEISSLDSPCITKEEAWELWHEIKEIDPELAELCRHQVERKVDEPWHDGRDPKEVFNGLADANWVREKLADWANDINKIRKRILGLFPSESTSKAFPSCRVAAAQHFWLIQEEEEKDLARPPRITRAGIDVAGDGPDYTVLSYLQGQRVHFAWATQEGDPTLQADMVNEWLETLGDNKPHVIVVDVSGVGHGLFHNLRKLKRENPKLWRGVRLEKYVPNEKSPDPETSIYMVDWCYFELAKYLKPTLPWEERLGLPPDDRVPIIEKYGDKPTFGTHEDCRVSIQFPERGYTEDVWERKRLENKPKLDERNAKSPDLADAATSMMKPIKRGRVGVV